MSNREFAKNLIDHVPESKLLYVVAYLQGVVVPDEMPNAATLEAIENARKGIGLSRGFSSVDELMEDLDADD